MRQILRFLLFVQLFATIWCQCKFTLQQVEDETRVVGIYINQKLQILNEDTVKPGETLYFICSSTDFVAVTCGANNKFSRKLPIQNCASSPKAVVEEVADSACRTTTYRVGYKIPNGFLELYRSCFDKQKLSTVVISHYTRPYSLGTKRPEQAFTTDGVMTLRNVASYQKRNVFQRFKSLLGENQPYVHSESDIVIDRGHLAPSADYLFPINMRATFKMVNIIPQFSTINRGNWKTIEGFVRRTIDNKMSAYILTGAFDVLTLRDKNQNFVQMYLEDNNRIPIPKWIYKIVKCSAGTYVFLTYNNIIDPPPTPICKTITCPLQFKNNAESGITFCCDPDDFAKNVYPNIH